MARATLEAIAYQSVDAVRAIEAATGTPISSLKADGCATANRWLMQFQADILNVPVVRPEVTETTALGAGYLAGLGVGFWATQEEIAEQWHVERRFEPNMSADKRAHHLCVWNEAIQRSMKWSGS